MTRVHRWILLLACGLMPSVAYASDFTGIATYIWGLPGAVVGALVAASFLAFRASRRQKVFAAILFGPIIAAALWLFSVDTIWMFRRGHTGDLVLGGIYIALLVLIIGLVARIILRPLAPEASGQKPLA